MCCCSLASPSPWCSRGSSRPAGISAFAILGALDKVNLARRADTLEAGGEWQADAALIEAEYGNADLTRRAARAALDLSTGRDVSLYAAMALARAGAVQDALAVADRLDREGPSDSIPRLIGIALENAGPGAADRA